MTGAVSWGLSRWMERGGEERRGGEAPFQRQLRRGGRACSDSSEEGLLAVEAVELPWRPLSSFTSDDETDKGT